MSKAESLDARLEALESLQAPALRLEWEKVYGTPAPRRIGRDLLLRAVAYRIQEQALGGLKPATKRRLLQIAAALKAGKPVTPVGPARLQPGTQLMREWNGRMERVEVLASGFAWQGQVYKTLTAVARAITGTHWSGPRFFGLEGKGKP
ncbi:MAG: DUF2924 domain-containing protein [Rhodospirillales bacterium]|nr:DUF2924 domain-containing protein [Rhodospirillales bacterium]